MSTRILLIAHAPLANALRDCALHVFPDCAQAIIAIDVPPDEPPEQTLANAKELMMGHAAQDTLILTDVLGATPANVAQRLVDDVQSHLIAGVNLPMLLRTVCYRHEDVHALAKRAVDGGAQGVVQVEISKTL
ncbi:ManX Phosphotransferase system, mannose/fructose-specific component IIA [Burkholderiaceae bacterium]|jgi:PTS system mannose-specific IIA component|nr:PTS fructose transporter subunit IIA [Limnohabitans sp.]